MIQVLLTYIVNVIIVFIFFPILESVVQYIYISFFLGLADETATISG